MFGSLDTNGDGVISKAEFDAAMNSTGSVSQSTSTTDDLVEGLVEALKNSSSNTSDSSGTSTSYQSVSELLSAALKSYMQLGTGGFSQISAGTLGSGLYV